MIVRFRAAALLARAELRGAICDNPAPSVIELDYDGNVVQAWGGPSPDGKHDWPSSGGKSTAPCAGGTLSGMHSVFVDHNDNV